VDKIEVLDLGRRSYSEAFHIQLKTVQAILEGQQSHCLLLVEHDPVITLGASFHAENLLYPPEWYDTKGIDIQKTDRGGDVTFHGPGQLVAYPIFDVSLLGKDLHKWLRDLEQTVIESLSPFGLKGERLDVNSGVWVEHKKICAIGIKMRRWISMHGIALNCNIDLKGFQTIVPCGIRTHGVTSISNALNREVTIEEMRPYLIEGFKQVFNLKIQELGVVQQ
jgi:lipoyl(octanoyl) transferase